MGPVAASCAVKRVRLAGASGSRPVSAQYSAYSSGSKRATVVWLPWAARVLSRRFDLPEIGRVVVEGEGAVAPHRPEVLFVGQQADGAGDFAAQDASHGVVLGVRHVSPCAQSINAHSQ